MCPMMPDFSSFRRLRYRRIEPRMPQNPRADPLRSLAAHTDLARRMELVPPSAQARGVYFRGIERALDRAGRRAPYEALFPERFFPVLWYPYGEFLPRLVAAGAILAGPERAYEGMREIGRGNAVAFGQSLLGRVLLGLLERDPKLLLRQGSVARRQSCNYGQWAVEFQGEGEATVTMTEEYGYIDSYLVGAAEGTFESIGLPVRIDVELVDPFHGRHVLRW